jgi:type I restriction enzyme S subunit
METVKLGLLIKKTKVARCGEHSYPVLSITKQDGIIMQSEKFKKRIASADTSDYKIIPRGKLVQGIHIDEGNFGIQDIVDNGIVSPAYGVWDVNDGLVVPKYLEMVLRSPKSIEFYRSKLTGTVSRRGHMSDTDFLSMDVPLPDKDTQSKILEIMKQTTSVLCSRQQQLSKLDELVKARFVEMFGDILINSMGWTEAEIGVHCFVTKLAGFEYTQYIQYENFGEVVMVKAQNIKNGKLNDKDLSYISAEVSELLPRSQLMPGDVVMTYVGANIGDVAVIDNKYKYHLAPNVAKIRPDSSVYNSVFLMKLLMYMKLYIVKNSADTAKAALGMSRIRKLKAIVPPLSLQNDFATFVECVDQQKQNVQQSLEKLELLKKALMQEYFG